MSEPTYEELLDAFADVRVEFYKAGMEDDATERRAHGRLIHARQSLVRYMEERAGHDSVGRKSAEVSVADSERHSTALSLIYKLRDETRDLMSQVRRGDKLYDWGGWEVTADALTRYMEERTLTPAEGTYVIQHLELWQDRNGFLSAVGLSTLAKLHSLSSPKTPAEQK